MHETRVLMIEDSEDDALLLTRSFKKSGREVRVTRVETEGDFREALRRPEWDAILCDYNLPRFSADAALAILKEHELDLPFIIFSGTIGEEAAVSLMKSGAHDYVMKDKVARLIPAIEREIREAGLRRRKREAEAERDRLLVEERKARNQAEEALALRDEFLTIASHELNTPLTPLNLQLARMRKLLDRKLADEPGSGEGEHPGSSGLEPLSRALRSCERQSSRLQSLVDSILEVSRIRTGRFQLALSVVDLGELVSNVVDDLRPQAELVGSSINLRAEKGVVGRWDRGRIEQAVVSLLNNAVKFGAGHPIDIVVSSSGRPLRAVIEVVDHGIGIQSEDHDRIFLAFERAVAASSYSGFGIGLYVTRHMVEAHGGKVTVESRQGEGTRFRIELPLEQVAEGTISHSA